MKRHSVAASRRTSPNRHAHYSMIAIVGVVALFALIILVATFARPTGKSGWATQAATVAADAGGSGRGSPSGGSGVPSTPARSFQAQYCADSDGGLKYDVKGTITTQGGSRTDRCGSENLLYEYYCKGNLAGVGQKECPCKDGVCVKTQAPADTSVEPVPPPQTPPAQENYCTDSDGKDITTQGYVYGMYGGQQFKKYDACVNANSVDEYLCDGNSPRDYNYACPDGMACDNGACVKTVPLPKGNSCVWSKDPNNCGANGDGYLCVYTLSRIQTAYLDSSDRSCSGRVQARLSEVQFQECNLHTLTRECGFNDLAAEPAYGDFRSTVEELGGLCCK